MGFLDYLRLKGVFTPDKVRHPEQETGWLSALLPRTGFDYASEVEGRDSSIVMAAALWLARSFPEAPLRVYETDSDGNSAPAPEHDLYRLLRRPNPHYSGALLWMATVIDFVIDGNAYWLKVYTAGSQVAQLWWAPCSMLEPVGDENAYITHYEYRPDVTMREPIKLPPSEVVHFRYGLDPDNIRKGRSPLRAALREVFTDDEAANFTAALLKNLGVPGVVMVPKEGVNVTKEAAESIKRTWMQKLTGDKRGEPVILNAAVGVEKLAFSPKDLDLRALRRIPEERITALTGVPAVVAQMGAGLEHMTYNNMGEAKESAYENGIIPIQRLFGAELDVQLLPDFEGDREDRSVGFDNSQIRVLQEDLNRLEERVGRGLERGGITRAEYRAALSHETTDADDVYYIPSNQVVTPAGALPEIIPPTEKAFDPETITRDGWESKARPSVRRLPQAFARAASGLADDFATDLQGAFLRLGETVRMRLLALANEGKAAGGDASPWPPQWDRLIEDPSLIDGLFSTDAIDQELSEVYSAHYNAIVESTVNLVGGAVDSAVSVGTMLQDPVMLGIVRDGGTRTGLVDLAGQTREAIYAGLTEAREAGLGPREAAKRISEHVEGRNLYPGIWQRRYQREIERGATEAQARERATETANRYRAETIARTETKYSQNLSSLRAYELSEVVDAVRVHDGDGCGWTSHTSTDKAHGKIVSFQEASDHPLAHPRCVRSFSPVRKKSG